MLVFCFVLPNSVVHLGPEEGEEEVQCTTMYVVWDRVHDVGFGIRFQDSFYLDRYTSLLVLTHRPRLAVCGKERERERWSGVVWCGGM